MDAVIAIGILACIALAAFAGRPADAATAGMEREPVKADDIRTGVANGWYTCVLVTVGGKPAVRLSGKTTNGRDFTDVYPISWEDWDALKAEGYNVEL